MIARRVQQGEEYLTQTLCSVVVPVYSAPLLEALHRQLSEALEAIPAVEFLFVDDASTDGSTAVLRSLATRDARVRAVLLSQNMGQQEATLCGLSLARGGIIANLDGDLQHPTALLPQMIEILQREHLDIVYAVPEGGQTGWLQRLGGRLRDAFFRRAFHLPTGLQVSSYRVMTAQLAGRVVASRGRFNYFSAMVFARPTRARTLRYPFQARPAGHSSYSALRRVRLYLRILWHYGPFAPRQKPPIPFLIQEEIHGVNP